MSKVKKGATLVGCGGQRGTTRLRGHGVLLDYPEVPTKLTPPGHHLFRGLLTRYEVQCIQYVHLCTLAIASPSATISVGNQF